MPPYHPELQPIEKIMEAGNRVGRSPAKTMVELKVKVRNLFTNNIMANMLIGAYKAVQAQEDNYVNLEDGLDSAEDLPAPTTRETASDSKSEGHMLRFYDEVFICVIF